MKKTSAARPILLGLVGLVACSGEPTQPGVQPTPSPGETSFFSADGNPGQQAFQNGDTRLAGAEVPTDTETGTADPRTVEEGDIYRVTDNGLILNLNAYRGLQIIDFANPANPTVIGRVRVSGSPVEMYQVGDRVYLLLNNWYGYYGNRESVRAQSFHGGLVLVADVSDPRAPRITGRAQVPGNITSSRLTRGNGHEALFVAASDYNSNTYVKSFSVSEAGALVAKTQIELGGFVTAIQASPERLMVANYDWNQRTVATDVSLIDISDPNGTMVLGGTVRVEGIVQNKHNMNVEGDVMRIVSGNNWSSAANANHVETFDIANIQAISRIDHATFGQGESLFATLFLGEKAFFVTYERVDPLHAYEITPAGRIFARSEFIVSGWNDYFRPVANEQRMIGIGKNDQAGNTLAVSLYDISVLTNRRPLIDRAEIDLSWSWSEANWDDRAFSVLEQATNVAAPDGTIETGLVLLPFSGWDQSTNSSASGVQIFTFSDRTLTRRGVMAHDTPVRRSFLADPDDHVAGNLSEVELSLFDTTNPDAPAELGRVELAPDYSGFLVFGTYGVRRSNDSAYWGWWWGGQTNAGATDRLEVVSLTGDVDVTAPLASLAIPAGARVLKIAGNRVAVVSSVYGEPSTSGANPPVTTAIEVISFANPAAPARLGTFETDALPFANGYYGGYGYAEDVACFGCRGGYSSTGMVTAVENALVFVEPIQEVSVEGQEVVEYTWPVDDGRWNRCWDQTGSRACTYVTGGLTCTQLTRVDGTEEPQICYGGFYRCEQDANGATDCVEVSANTIATQRNSSSYERLRYWNHYDMHVVDVSGPGAATLGPVVAMANNEEAVTTLAVGSDFYVTHKRPHRVAGDARPFVRYFFRKIGLEVPQRPSIDSDVNIPGELVSVEGNRILTRDYLWGRRIVETTVNRLTLQQGRARLDGARRFADRWVNAIRLDGRGHALVSHGPSWNYNAPSTADQVVRLTTLDVAGPQFALLSELDVDSWASLQAGWNGRALFSVPGGMLVVNLDDARRPFAQAYFPVIGWPSEIAVDGDDIYLAASRFGLYTLNANTFNLLQP